MAVLTAVTDGQMDRQRDSNTITYVALACTATRYTYVTVT